MDLSRGAKKLTTNSGTSLLVPMHPEIISDEPGAGPICGDGFGSHGQL